MFSVLVKLGCYSVLIIDIDRDLLGELISLGVADYLDVSVSEKRFLTTVCLMSTFYRLKNKLAESEALCSREKGKQFLSQCLALFCNVGNNLFDSLVVLYNSSMGSFFVSCYFWGCFGFWYVRACWFYSLVWETGASVMNKIFVFVGKLGSPRFFVALLNCLIKMVNDSVEQLDHQLSVVYFLFYYI